MADAPVQDDRKLIPAWIREESARREHVLLCAARADRHYYGRSLLRKVGPLPDRRAICDRRVRMPRVLPLRPGRISVTFQGQLPITRPPH